MQYAYIRIHYIEITDQRKVTDLAEVMVDGLANARPPLTRYRLEEKAEVCLDNANDVIEGICFSLKAIPIPENVWILA